MAEGFLRRQGARILARNLVTERGELDIIMRWQGRRVAVEVKSGTSERFDPLVHFDAAKKEQVHRLARLQDCRRVDLVTVSYRADGVWIRWLKGGWWLRTFRIDAGAP